MTAAAPKSLAGRLHSLGYLLNELEGEEDEDEDEDDGVVLLA